jgi:hypothetical protein
MARDFIDEMQAEAVLRFGAELTPEEAGKRFAGHSQEERIFHLKNLQSDGDLTVDEAAKRYSYEKALRRTHTILSKVGR